MQAAQQRQRWTFSWGREVEFGDIDTNDHVNSVLLLRTTPPLHRSEQLNLFILF
jgi:hypothetical protein